MTDDRVEGGLKKGMGKIEDAWGGLSGDTATQAKGKLNQAAGTVQDAVGKAKDQAQDAVGQAKDRALDVYDEIESYAREQPLQTLAAALAVGIVVGLVLRGGRKTVYVRK